MPGSSTTYPSRRDRRILGALSGGYYANAARGKRRKAALVGDTTRTPRRQDDDEFCRRNRLSWAKLIRRVYEVDPLLCPFCGAEMKILAFIVDFGAAKAICKSLELPAQEPEPLAHAPPEIRPVLEEVGFSTIEIVPCHQRGVPIELAKAIKRDRKADSALFNVRAAHEFAMD